MCIYIYNCPLHPYFKDLATPFLKARHFQWPPEQIGERNSERVRAGKRAAKFIACASAESGWAQRGGQGSDQGM